MIDTILRASSVYSICTHRPKPVDLSKVTALEKKLKTKVEKEFKKYSRDDLEIYTVTTGMATDAKAMISFVKNLDRWDNDPLPPGAMSYLQKLWLNREMGFFEEEDMDTIATRNGNLQEEEAIKITALTYDAGENEIEKNDLRLEKLILSGECDVKYIIEEFSQTRKVIRDQKVPINWKTFRSKLGFTSQYYWQLIAYCYLFGATEAYLDFTLMPLHNELVEEYCANMSDADKVRFANEQVMIESLPPEKRVKSYPLTSQIYKEIEFLTSRIEKAKEYYDSLTYEVCMNFDPSKATDDDDNNW